MSILTKPLDNGIRGEDKYGSGAFGAERTNHDGSKRWHLGVDLIASPDENVLAPAECIVTAHGIAYADDPRFKTLHLTSVDEPDVEFRLLYVQPIAPLGTHQMAGAVIARAQDISLRDVGITKHVHFEMRRNGVPVDPTEMLQDA